MKYLFLLLIFVLNFISCTTNSTNEESSKIEEIQNLPLENKNHTTTDRIISYSFTGSLEGDIPIEISISQFGTVLKGELIYKKVGKPITLIGDASETNYWRVLEFSDKGMVTGILTGDFNNLKKLSWFSPTNRKSIPMNLESKLIENYSIDFAPKNIGGRYFCKFGKEGYTGSLIIHEVKNDSIYFDVSALTQAPARNMAILKNQVGLLSGNKTFIEFKEEDYIDCAFQIEFFNGFAQIKHEEERTTCGFGHNAHIDGLFKKMN